MIFNLYVSNWLNLTLQNLLIRKCHWLSFIYFNNFNTNIKQQRIKWFYFTLMLENDTIDENTWNGKSSSLTIKMVWTKEHNKRRKSSFSKNWCSLLNCKNVLITSYQMKMQKCCSILSTLYDIMIQFVFCILIILFFFLILRYI